MSIASIAALVAAAGPQVLTVPVTIGDVTQQIRVRRLSFKEAHDLGVMALGTDNKPDVSKLTAFRANLLAKTIVGDDDKPACTVEEVEELPPEVVIALEKAARDVNHMNEGAAKAVEKNS